MSDLQILAVVAVLLVALTLGVAITLTVRLVRTRKALSEAGLPVTKRWVFWAALAYLVFPVDVLPDPVFIDDIGVLLLALRSMRSSAGSSAKEGERLPAKG
ncbi:MULTISPECIES: YkvA family protein [unclassified Streptomyces]|uniref:YkvA family protein n=1 Tax=unclassified Streptomyces TaxID=2593676 RepID=UPI0038069567